MVSLQSVQERTGVVSGTGGLENRNNERRVTLRARIPPIPDMGDWPCYNGRNPGGFRA